jgi:carboxyl-terminal processing protease
MSRGRLIFVCISLTVVLFVAGTTMLAANNRQSEDGADSLYKYLSVFTEVFSLVNRAYVDELDPEALMAGAFEGTVDALDPFSLYIPADQVESFQATREIGSRRSGIVVLKERGVAYAVAVEEGSPAAAAKIESGHILSSIQGRRTRQMPLYQIQAILAGAAGTEVEIERLESRGQKETVRFALADYPPPAVELEVRRGIGVLRLPGFHADTPVSVESSLQALAAGSEALPDLTETDKLVVDLRGVAGGDAGAAYRIAGFFATGELGALTRRGDTVERFDGAQPPLWQGQIAVLISRGTQGAAEILTTVLRQSAGAKVIGEHSFGHSGRQSLLELSSGGRLLVTDAFYTGPDHKPLNESLEPDVPIRASQEPEDPTVDEVLERGLKVLLGEEKVEPEPAAA